jgi:diguanylate cyclase (GGDEF)-like protein
MASEVEKQLERAKRAIEKGKTADAIAAYQAVLQAAPTTSEAMQALGDLFIQQNDPVRAANYYGLLFDRLADSREEPRAAALYTRFLRSSEQPPERQARYALALQRQNKVGEAIEHFSVAAEHFMSKGKEDEALRCLEQVAELDPTNAERQISLAELAEKRGKGAVAARSYVRAGQLALAAGETQKAIARLAAANQAVPDDRDVALLYAQALMMSSEAGLAVTALESFAATEQPSPTFSKCFGEALLRAGQVDRARAILEEYYETAGGDNALLFQVAEHYGAESKDDKAVEVLTAVRQRFHDAGNDNAFAARLDKIAEANPRSLPIIEFWSLVYSGMNREARYFETLVTLFDAYLENDNMKGACDTLDRMVDIDPYDFHNQQRLERLNGLADKDYLLRVASRLGVTLSQGDADSDGNEKLSGEKAGGTASAALDDLLVQAEIFIQYSLQPKAVERLQKVAEVFPYESQTNERYLGLCEMAGWWPEGVTRRASGEAAERLAAKPKSVRADLDEEEPRETPVAPSPSSGIFTQETLRDLAKIAEIGQNIYRQASPKEMLSYTVNEIGKHLRATRCIAVVGEPGQPPQLAAEFCAAGVGPLSASQVMRLVSQLERAAPDVMGGLPLDVAAAPMLGEVGLATALGVSLMDKETQAPAGVILTGHGEPHKWKPNESYFLQTVGDQMLQGVSHTRLRSLVRTMTVGDRSTGLLARSAYTDRLLGEAQRAKTQDASLSVAILQIDSGPDLIRQQGEALVENFLEQITRAVLPLVRVTDLAVKYTAWSLAFVFPDTTLAGALGMIEKMRQAVVNGRKENTDSALRMTVSAGVVEAIARVDYDTEDIVTDLINRAESSLEEARKRGGDSVVSLTSSKA